MSNIVITYFEPFGGRTTNASNEVVSLLNGYITKELPVSWNKISTFIDEILADNPDYLFMVGEAGSYQEITIERSAHNIANGKDNENVTLNNEPIIKSGNDILATKFDLSGLNYRVSDDAGKYLCNYSYYLALAKAKNTKVLFIHLPYINNNLDSLKEDLINIIESLAKED